MINAPVEVVKNQKIVVDQIQNIINQFKNQKKMTLPFYFPKKREATAKLHLAIWNCGTRPQTFIQKLKDIRITIRKNHKPILVIKKGNY